MLQKFVIFDAAVIIIFTYVMNLFHATKTFAECKYKCQGDLFVLSFYVKRRKTFFGKIHVFFICVKTKCK